ncbi:hypothetical protein Ct9H90mP29_01220 [bacterium]|nr:MAG: hypothetical protein Ct9H90mP29_01220 [bacterium]
MYITVNGQQVEDGKGNNIFDENQGRGILFHNETSTKNNWLKVRLEGKKIKSRWLWCSCECL